MGLVVLLAGGGGNEVEVDAEGEEERGEVKVKGEWALGVPKGGGEDGGSGLEWAKAKKCVRRRGKEGERRKGRTLLKRKRKQRLCAFVVGLRISWP